MEKKLITASSLTELARKTIENYIENNSYVYLDDESLKEFKNQKAGVFVTIYKNGELRGCIGTIGPVQENVLLEIIKNAVSSATQDPRFPVVKKEELGNLKYSVNVLMPPEQINSPDLLDPQRYGVIVTGKFNRRGLLLPRIESINTVDEQIAHACYKAGIGSNEEIGLFRFESIEHKE